MGAIGKKIFTVAVGLLLAAGVPYVARRPHTPIRGPGAGTSARAVRSANAGTGRDATAEVTTGSTKGCTARTAGTCTACIWTDGGPMKEGMARHMEEMRGTIVKLRALEAKMEALKSKDDAAAFRAASLEHSKLLTDLQDSHLKHMEGMMGGK